jgi:hypothetical protein
MMNRSKSAAALLASLALVPVLAAGRPACCIKAPVASAHGCCPAMAPAQASAPKGCCKAPVAPKSDAKLKDGAPIAISIASFIAGSPAQSSTALMNAVSVRLARRAHHAETPDDSPPDRLSQLHILLI